MPDLDSFRDTRHGSDVAKFPFWHRRNLNNLNH
jgi:hypothetical protein